MPTFTMLNGCVLLDPCENAITGQIKAPKDPWEVVVFECSCGTTTGKSIQVSIL